MKIFQVTIRTVNGDENTFQMEAESAQEITSKLSDLDKHWIQNTEETGVSMIRTSAIVSIDVIDIEADEKKAAEIRKESAEDFSKINF